MTAAAAYSFQCSDTEAQGKDVALLEAQASPPATRQSGRLLN